MGDMSLVGPRPLPFSEADNVDGWRRTRFEVRPGITSTWHVFGRAERDYDTRIRMHIKYVRSYSLLLDIHILLMTLPAVSVTKIKHTVKSDIKQ